jgi:hypothetical protein
MTSPPGIRLSVSSSTAASEGPRDRYRPATAHVAIIAGAEEANGLRAGAGTAISGRSDASQPGRRWTGSGSNGKLASASA